MSDRVIESTYIEIEFAIKPEEWKKITEAIKKLKVLMKSMGRDVDKTFTAAGGALKSVSKNITSIKKNSRQLTTTLNKVNRSAERSATTFQRIFKSVRKVNTEVGEATRKTSKFADMAKRAGAAMVVLGAGKKGVDTFAGLEEQLIRTKRISGATDKEFKKLKSTVESLGKMTQFSAKEIAIAAKTLARSGLGSDEIIATLPAVLDLSVATEFDLTNSASAVTEAMAAFGEKDAKRVADMFTTATNKANISMGTLGADIKNVQSSAGGLGISLNEVVSAIALMGNVGLKGGEAGTALNSFLTTMKQKADENKDLDFGKFKIGLTTDEGNLRNLDDIFKDISSKLKDMNKFEASQAITEVFNVRGEKAASTFAQMLKKNNNALSDFMGLLDDSKGAARQNAEDIENSTSGALARISASMESIFKSIGSILEPVVFVLDKFLQLIAAISDTLVGKVVLGVVLMTLSFVALVGTGSRVVGMFKDWWKVTTDLIPWISKLNLGLKWSAIWSKMATLEFWLIVAAVAATIAVIYDLWKFFKTGGGYIGGLVKKFQEFYSTLSGGAQLIFDVLLFPLKMTWFWIKQIFKGVNWILNLFKGKDIEKTIKLDVDTGDLDKIDTEDLKKKMTLNLDDETSKTLKIIEENDLQKTIRLNIDSNELNKIDTEDLKKKMTLNLDDETSKTLKIIEENDLQKTIRLNIDSNELNKIDTEDLKKKIDYNTNIHGDDNDNRRPDEIYPDNGGYKPDFTIPQSSGIKEEKHYHKKEVVFNQGAIVVQGSGLSGYELEKIMKRVMSGEIEMNGAQMGVDMDG